LPLRFDLAFLFGTVGVICDLPLSFGSIFHTIRLSCAHQQSASLHDLVSVLESVTDTAAVYTVSVETVKGADHTGFGVGQRLV
jgi:hypothetical protein